MPPDPGCPPPAACFWWVQLPGVPPGVPEAPLPAQLHAGSSPLPLEPESQERKVRWNFKIIFLPSFCPQGQGPQLPSPNNQYAHPYPRTWPKKHWLANPYLLFLGVPHAETHPHSAALAPCPVVRSWYLSCGQQSQPQLTVAEALALGSVGSGCGAHNAGKKDEESGCCHP